MKHPATQCKRHRFPPEIIRYAVCLYWRINLSHRDIEDLLARRGILVTHESIRLWCSEFGPHYAQRRYSHPVDRSTGVVFDQTLVLQGYQPAKDYPESFRGIRYRDPETGKRLLFIANNTALPALKICALYKARWQVELFFRCIKQHLRIKAFFGTSENAAKSQIRIAVSVCVLVDIIIELNERAQRRMRCEVRRGDWRIGRSNHRPGRAYLRTGPHRASARQTSLI